MERPLDSKVDGQYSITNIEKANEVTQSISKLLVLLQRNFKGDYPDSLIQELKTMTNNLTKYKKLDLPSFAKDFSSYSGEDVLSVALLFLNEINNNTINKQKDQLSQYENEINLLKEKIKSLSKTDRSTQIENTGSFGSSNGKNSSNSLSDSKFTSDISKLSREEEIKQIKRQIRDKYKDKILELNSMVQEIPPLQDEIFRLRKKLKSKSKDESNSQTTIQSYESELRETKASVVDLQNQLQTALAENERLSQITEQTSKSILSERSQGIAEGKQKFQYLISEMAQNYQGVSRELTDVIQQRNKLFELVNSQQILLMKHENAKNQTTSQKEIVVERPIPNKLPNINDLILDSIDEINHDNIEDAITDILKLTHQDKSYTETIESLINLLLERVRSKEKIISEQNKKISTFTDQLPLVNKLTSLIKGQLSYIEKIAKIDDLQVDSSLRESIYHNISDTKDYIEKNCGQINDQKSIFGFLESDPEKIKENILTFLSKYENPQTAEGIELYLILKQSIALS
ncbi:hypothetical protein TVAG_457370 [Trichomonas vaginalis G3]|uniref:Uncharacterized protein n=1 Tax=Trichomonas vaginalis (strain ATCC PRA-98 / G3) TaxID=412133 RepID=A2DC61_TRIV3|nr:hypothetical protein TVAGG3_0263040 [Trichomonas vaginalis G3]EAY22102.1 hypothetical protein TVAG_457370 [Trichomonas vaginalis G3]KAI5525255.1 hypothetical protein TVAGG3_0263040 [Trichomonas vaginalis G3]|eukprot:XP_001583088.1 hypothetical protein [Trichomonas vaginalis G3]